MIVYIDHDFMCHEKPAVGLRPFADDFFNGKCARFIEGYRYVPEGETWTRSDGVEFTGKMIAPAVDSRVLEAYQKQYEAMLAEMSAAYQEGVNSI